MAQRMLASSIVIAEFFIIFHLSDELPKSYSQSYCLFQLYQIEDYNHERIG